MDTNTYALIAPEGSLAFKRGVPSARMWADVDPHFGVFSGFTLTMPSRHGAHGMRGYTAACSARHPESYAPNETAKRVMTALGAPEQPWFGNLVLCGELAGDTGSLDLCGLTKEQQERIRNLHAGAGSAQ
ncbi:hypothetical protein BIV23_43615 [Streptomyces monashensis]|uniref:Uncharacterized protein n=1 Tax=Streptomyces monashensis TaxID=1678012 RepID=A0A1S2NZV1_9ACTN|nr:hypothetical protein BIV23_43615 [Streptomyces monashensis]